MTKDMIFRIFSIIKPATSVSMKNLYEVGKKHVLIEGSRKVYDVR